MSSNAKVIWSSGPRDWTEDFDYENGNYMGKCFRCSETFFGHKRRVTCKLCANGITPPEKLAKFKIRVRKGKNR